MLYCLFLWIIPKLMAIFVLVVLCTMRVVKYKKDKKQTWLLLSSNRLSLSAVIYSKPQIFKLKFCTNSLRTARCL